MNIFYNKKVFPNVLFITLQHDQSEQYHYETFEDIVVISNQDKRIIGLNIFNIESLNIDGQGNIKLTSQQIEHLQQKLDRLNLDIQLVVDDKHKFIVGYVKNKIKHPNADKLNICQVDIGQEQELQIVCGAANVEAHQKVVVATIGAVMPSGMVIQATQLRGVDSFGMLCSAKELGISQDLDKPGILVLSDDYEVGQSFII